MVGLWPWANHSKRLPAGVISEFLRVGYNGIGPWLITPNKYNFFVLGGMKRDSILSCSQGPAQFSSLGSTGEITPGEPPTPAVGHVRPFTGLTKCPYYLFCTLDHTPWDKKQNFVWHVPVLLPISEEKLAIGLDKIILSLPLSKLSFQPANATTQLQGRRSTNWAIPPSNKSINQDDCH